MLFSRFTLCKIPASVSCKASFRLILTGDSIHSCLTPSDFYINFKCHTWSKAFWIYESCEHVSVNVVKIATGSLSGSYSASAAESQFFNRLLWIILRKIFSRPSYDSKLGEISILRILGEQRTNFLTIPWIRNINFKTLVSNFILFSSTNSIISAAIPAEHSVFCSSISRTGGINIIWLSSGIVKQFNITFHSSPFLGLLLFWLRILVLRICFMLFYISVFFCHQR